MKWRHSHSMKIWDSISMLRTQSNFGLKTNFVHPSLMVNSDSLIERLRLNSSIQYHIYQANKQEYFDLENKNVEIKLYHNQSTYFIEVMGRNGTAIKATSIVNNTENEIYKREPCFGMSFPNSYGTINLQFLTTPH